MNDAEMQELVAAVARDVPYRTDDEAVEALRSAVEQRRHGRRRIRSAVAVAAAAAVILGGVFVWPDRSAVDVASEDFASPTVDVAADLDAYNGALPPIVVVSTDRRQIRLLDAFSLQPDAGPQRPFAVVVASEDVTAASAGTGTMFLEFDSPGGVPFTLEIDLASGTTLRRWDGVSNLAVEGSEGRFAYLTDPASERGATIVVENPANGVIKTFPVPETSPSPTGPIAWSDDGRIAVGHADGSVRVLSLSDDLALEDAVLIDGPIYGPDWADDDTLVGTRECCGDSAIVTIDIDSGVMSETGNVGSRAVDAGESGSPWGILYIDTNDSLRGTEGPDVAHLEDVAGVRW